MKAQDKIIELMAIISEKNVLQAKVMHKLADELSQEEKEGLATLINFYEKTGNTITYLAECYLWLIQSLYEEQYYFIKNGNYRYSNSEEVNQFLYQNPDLMDYYVKGLAISQYLIDQHRQCRKIFCDNIELLCA